MRIFIAGPLFALLPVPPMTREQYLMLSSPNVPSGKFRGVKDLLGRTGTNDLFCGTDTEPI